MGVERKKTEATKQTPFFVARQFWRPRGGCSTNAHRTGHKQTKQTHPTKNKKKNEQSNMTTIDQIDPNQLYFRDCRTNASGAKTIFISRHPTSTDPEHNLAFQLSPENSWWSGEHLARAKFGIDSPMEGSRDESKRSLSLTAEDPALIPWLRAVEETVIKMATERSEELWGKKMESAVVRDKLVSVCKDAPVGKEGELKPLIKTKIVLKDPSNPEQRNVTQVFVADGVTRPGAEHPNGKIDLTPVEDPLRSVTRGSKCLAKVKVTTVWKSPIGFGITLMLTHLVVWPAETPSANNAFTFGGAAVTVRPKEIGGGGGGKYHHHTHDDPGFEEDPLATMMME